MATTSTLSEPMANEDHQELVTRFSRFLNDVDGDGEYEERVKHMVDTKSTRLLVAMDDLRGFDTDLANRVLRRPVPHIRAFEAALQQMVDSDVMRKTSNSAHHVEYKVGFTGNFGGQQVSPRALLAHMLGSLVCVEGIVTKLSLVRPKLVKSVHHCEATGQNMHREYKDAYSMDGLPTPAAMPKVDEEGNPLQIEFGLSTFRDFQSMHIQEMPERAPLGQLPRSIEVVLEQDLVDSVKPGDRIQVVGVYRAIVFGLAAGFKTVLFANATASLGKDIASLVMTPNDLKNIRTISKQDEPFNVLSRSLAPSIYGHAYIKKAILLMLLGGAEKNLANGTHLRGDVNMLLVGDPSTAKSQMLRFVLGIAPLAISTTGRGSSGVGLTAAVTSDADTGERRLEAGAMVLADRGVVCIDEFDKMSDADRVAIHEVMEQQTVTISKAGIHASLNARCSVLAAANPIYGAYDKDSSPQKNVGLPDSLLSRFDLLFIVLDNLSPEHDRSIADHVLRMHRYERGSSGCAGSGGVGGSNEAPGGGASGGSNKAAAAAEDPNQGSSVYEKFNPLLHGGFAAAALSRGEQREALLSMPFLRKYIHYAKSRIKPTLTEEAQMFITEEYARLRQEQESKTLPVTPRQLETMIRLSTAHAKVRLSNIVETIDCEEAAKVMRFALYHVEDKPTPSDANDDEEEEKLDAQEEEHRETFNALVAENNSKRSDSVLGKRSKSASDSQGNKATDENDNTENTKSNAGEDTLLDNGNKRARAALSMVGADRGSPEHTRMKRFVDAVSELHEAVQATGEAITPSSILSCVNKKLSEDGGQDNDEELYTSPEAMKLIQNLEQDDKVVIERDGDGGISGVYVI